MANNNERHHDAIDLSLDDKQNNFFSSNDCFFVVVVVDVGALLD